MMIDLVFVEQCLHGDAASRRGMSTLTHVTKCSETLLGIGLGWDITDKEFSLTFILKYLSTVRISIQLTLLLPQRMCYDFSNTKNNRCFIRNDKQRFLVNKSTVITISNAITKEHPSSVDQYIFRFLSIYQTKRSI